MGIEREPVLDRRKAPRGPGGLRGTCIILSRNIPSPVLPGSGSRGRDRGLLSVGIFRLPHCDLVYTTGGWFCQTGLPVRLWL